MRRYFIALAILWTAALYAGTAITAGQAVVPEVAPDATIEQVEQAWAVFELQHVVLHAAAYAVLALLLAIPQTAQGGRFLPRLCAIVLGMVVFLGAGQELVQAAMRWDLRPGNSVLDLMTDAAGAGLGLLVYRIGARLRLPEWRASREA